MAVFEQVLQHGYEFAFGFNPKPERVRHTS
jgi:hypothetical protein